jgi:hypothetical protein
VESEDESGSELHCDPIDDDNETDEVELHSDDSEQEELQGLMVTEWSKRFVLLESCSNVASRQNYLAK